jgi:hypothetical protein
VDAGAPAAASTKHWAYVAPIRPALPSVRSLSGCRNPIDLFVLARLEKAGLKPSAEADRATLIRRVSLDLTGLPPTLDEVKAFEHDQTPGAYERVVDRLLASPAYGERQARIWLDLARYADSNGYEKDAERSMWPYRDWVISAFNQNMPYDQFTIEQIAGDLLPNPTLAQRVATGFNCNVMLNEEGGVDQSEQRWLRLIDMVGTTAQTWMGTTLNCAQCHDHKYDPFTQRDFYKFLAFFESSDPLKVELRPELAKQRAELRAEIARDEEALKKKTPGADAASVAALQKKADGLSGPWTSVFAEKAGAKAEANMRIRGAFLAPGEMVSAETPASLPAMPPSARRDRLGLARWLASKENPLTARVQVNRMWEAVFGTGIVETSENFGTQGAAPTHPELLDWLATEFMRRGWDMKAMNRLIVTSATYRQSSAPSPSLRAAGMKKDPRNQLLWHGPRFRLEAEMIRDNALAISGLLSRRVGGESVFPSQPDGIWDSPYSGERWQPSTGPAKYRRGIYTFWKRTATYPSFVILDATSREACTVRRIRTNTPLQALALLNDAAYMEAARALAGRMERGAADLRGKLALGFRLCLARRPLAAEVSRLASLFERLKARYLASPVDAAKVGKTPEAAAMTMVANVLLNLDETITKT